MNVHRDNHRHEAWNLESTALLLRKRFPQFDIWVVKPSVMQFKTFSVYSHFVTSDGIGCPDHSPGQGSWRHLSTLLAPAVDRVKLIQLTPGESSTNTCSENTDKSSAENSCGTERTRCYAPHADLPITLVGFSKGCVVLNQLVYDLREAGYDTETAAFVKQVTAMIWLDGGHNGGSNTWLTNEDVIKALVETTIDIHVHVTPYQVDDQMRKWVGKEQKRFVKALRKLGIKVRSSVHFADEERSLENHFKILQEF